jgi:hypothetical protein
MFAASRAGVLSLLAVVAGAVWWAVVGISRQQSDWGSVCFLV